jgi:hypothetical protein
LTIKTSIDDAVRNLTDANPTTITPLLAPKAKVIQGEGGKLQVTILGDGGEPMTPAVAIKNMQQQQEYGYLFGQPQQSTGGPQHDGKIDAATYRANRSTILSGGRFSNGR